MGQQLPGKILIWPIRTWGMYLMTDHHRPVSGIVLIQPLCVLYRKKTLKKKDIKNIYRYLSRNFFDSFISVLFSDLDYYLNKTMQFTHFTTKDGFPDDNIYKQQEQV